MSRLFHGAVVGEIRRSDTNTDIHVEVFTITADNEDQARGGAVRHFTGKHPDVPIKKVFVYDISDVARAFAREHPDGRPPIGGWRCFHCDEHFTDERCARAHFGADESAKPACQIKAGAEGGLVEALREAEAAAAEAWGALHSESSDFAKAYHGQTARHAQQLRRAEEAGYERGLADGRMIAAETTGRPMAPPFDLPQPPPPAKDD